MPIRTLNYTNRQRILREDVYICVVEERGDARFDAGLRLARYKLPGDARVFVEAYRQAHYMRFDFGQVGAMRSPDDRCLTDFDSVEGVLFRVKVVTPADPRGLLLAEVDQIRSRNSSDEDERRRPLLIPRPSWDLDDEIWTLEYDTQDTRLLINATLGDWRAMARDPVFIALVYPSALRSILWRVLNDEGGWRDTGDASDWRSRWLSFAAGLPGVGDPPNGEKETQIEDWIDSAASAFCRHHNIRAIYEDYWAGEQGQ